MTLPDALLLAFIAQMALRQMKDGYHVSICSVCHTLSAGNGMGGVCMNGHPATPTVDATGYVESFIEAHR